MADKALEIVARHGPSGFKAARAEAAPITRAINRLTKRPGWKQARATRSIYPGEKSG